MEIVRAWGFRRRRPRITTLRNLVYASLDKLMLARRERFIAPLALLALTIGVRWKILLTPFPL